MSWQLSDIRGKVRAVTGTPSSDQLTDVQIDEYINNYYTLTMPFELKEQIENQFLDFKSVVGQDIYTFPGGYFTDQPGAYADGFPLIFYQDPDIFYQDWPIQYSTDNLGTGNGVLLNFTGGLQNPPLIMGSLFITDGTQVLQDQGAYVLTGDGFGTIDYVTGLYNVTFNNPPASTDTIYGKYQSYAGNRPQGILFFNNEFTLRPVPDQVYQIHLQGYVEPNALVAGSTPLQEEWGPLIAYGAALEIFSDRGDMENYERYYQIFKRFENVALGRTIQQLSAEQSVGRF